MPTSFHVSQFVLPLALNNVCTYTDSHNCPYIKQAQTIFFIFQKLSEIENRNEYSKVKAEPNHTNNFDTYSVHTYFNIYQRPRVLLNMYNACLTRAVFPIRGKRQKLMSISKVKGDRMQASAYRPLCMLGSAGKLLEKLLKFSLNAAVENAGSLSERQYGFREGRSTIGATNEVLTRVKAAESGSRFSRMTVWMCCHACLFFMLIAVGFGVRCIY